jgi:hypothetical protein
MFYECLFMDIPPDFLPKGKVDLTIDFPAFGVRPARGVNVFEREVPSFMQENCFCQNKLLKHSSKMRPAVLVSALLEACFTSVCSWIFHQISYQKEK